MTLWSLSLSHIFQYYSNHKKTTMQHEGGEINQDQQAEKRKMIFVWTLRCRGRRPKSRLCCTFTRFPPTFRTASTTLVSGFTSTICFAAEVPL